MNTTALHDQRYESLTFDRCNNMLFKVYWIGYKIPIFIWRFPFKIEYLHGIQLTSGFFLVFFSFFFWHLAAGGHIRKYPSIIYRQIFDVICALVGNKIVDQSDVVGASPVGAAPTISSFST